MKYEGKMAGIDVFSDPCILRGELVLVPIKFKVKPEIANMGDRFRGYGLSFVKVADDLAKE